VFKKLILATVMSCFAMEAVAQQRTVVTSAPSAQEYVDMLFKAPAPAPAQLAVRTRGIQLSEPNAAPITAAPVAPMAPAAAPAPVGATLIAPAQPAIIAAPVRFDYNSAAIPASFEPYLTNLAEAMKRPEAAGKVVIVSGHTDAKGDAAYNMALSARRAKSVELFLIGHGVGAERVVSTGRGKTQLIAGHETEDALNRRVEFSVAAF
jgi:outer membrane protein OmpA-like peptidoglycan-associated protein